MVVPVVAVRVFDCYQLRYLLHTMLLGLFCLHENQGIALKEQIIREVGGGVPQD